MWYTRIRFLLHNNEDVTHACCTPPRGSRAPRDRAARNRRRGAARDPRRMTHASRSTPRFSIAASL